MRDAIILALVELGKGQYGSHVRIYFGKSFMDIPDSLYRDCGVAEDGTVIIKMKGGNLYAVNPALVAGVGH